MKSDYVWMCRCGLDVCLHRPGRDIYSLFNWCRPDALSSWASVCRVFCLLSYIYKADRPERGKRERDYNVCMCLFMYGLGFKSQGCHPGSYVCVITQRVKHSSLISWAGSASLFMSVLLTKLQIDFVILLQMRETVLLCSSRGNNPHSQESSVHQSPLSNLILRYWFQVGHDVVNWLF